MGFGDWGRNFVNSLPVVGGVMSSFWGDPDQEAMQAAFAKAREDMEMQRYNMMGGRMNAMNQGALAFGPRNMMLGEMMGKGPGVPLMDLGPMLQNPMTPEHQKQIRDAAFSQNPRATAGGIFDLPVDIYKARAGQR